MSRPDGAPPVEPAASYPPCATKDCPNGTLYGSALCTKCRWPGASGNNSRVLELEILLAEQVRRGGQDCPAARSLIERADRVRREADEQARSREQYLRRSDEVYGHHRDEAIHNGLERERLENGFYVAQSGIASLRLDRPLISWRRK